MVGFDHAMFGTNGRAFNQRQQVTLNPLTTDVCTAGVFTFTDFVDFIDKNDAVLLGHMQGFLFQVFLIYQSRRFFLDE